MELKEILRLLELAEAFAERLEQVWKEIKERMNEERDEKKRKELLDTCERRDPGAMRRILFD